MKTDSTQTRAAAASAGKRRRYLVLACILILLVAGGFGIHALMAKKAATPDARSGAGGRSGRQNSPVVAQAVIRGDMPVRLGALGTVTARSTATVRVQVSGRLEKILFHEGDTVKAGQVLARIDPRSFQNQVDSAAAQIAKDQALLSSAQIDLKRYQTLLAQNSIASQQVDTQSATVDQLKATLAADRATLAQAQLQLSYTRVTAPISGRVGLRQIDAGNLVQTSDSNGLVVITEVQPINVVFPVPQQQLQAVLARQKGGGDFAVEAWDADNRKLLARGKLASIDNLIDTTTGTIKLKAQFANDDGRLFPNQFVNVRLTVDTLENSVLAPMSAVQPGVKGSFVFVVDDSNKVSMRQVQAGPNDGSRVAVFSGLEPGERVITDGIDRVRDGATVQVMAQADTPAPLARKRGKHRPGSEGSEQDKAGGDKAQQDGKAPERHWNRDPQSSGPRGDEAQESRPRHGPRTPESAPVAAP